MIRSIVIVRDEHSDEINVRFSAQTHTEALEESLSDGENIPPDHIVELRLESDEKALREGSWMISGVCASPTVMVALADLFRRVYRAGQSSAARPRADVRLGDASFPQYQMFIDGESRWMSIFEAVTALADGGRDVEVGDLIIDALGSHPRNIIDDDRRRLNPPANENCSNEQSVHPHVHRTSRRACAWRGDFVLKKSTFIVTPCGDRSSMYPTALRLWRPRRMLRR